jgi:outer membrane protein assembly factor BamB
MSVMRPIVSAHGTTGKDASACHGGRLLSAGGYGPYIRVVTTFDAMIAALLAIGMPLVLAAGVHADDAGDWPAFRGPARDSVVHGVTIATDWSEHPPRQVWKRDVGAGWSSLVVVDGRLFTQEQRDDLEAVVCYNAATGEEVWAHTDEAWFAETMGGVGPRATPTFAEGRLFALGATGILNALDAASGDLIWSRDLTREGQGAAPPWGFCSSPLVVDGKVIVFAGGGLADEDEAAAPADAAETLIAFDAATGEPVWRAAAGSHSYSSAQLAVFDGVPQILFTGNAELAAFDPATGAKLWALPTNARQASPAVQPHPLDDNDLIASFSPTAGSLRVAIERVDDQWRPEVVWTSRDLKPFFSDFVRVGDYAYGFDSKLFCCVDLSTGKRAWKAGRYGSGQVLLLADQSVLLVTTDAGEAVLVAANHDEHVELGRFQAVEGKTWNHPTVVGRRLYVRNAEEMACYEL